MVIKFKSIFNIFLILSSISVFATCKRSECLSNSFLLKESWLVLPNLDSINIGDTLIFKSSFSNQPFDFNSNRIIDFSGGALVGTPFSLRAIIGYNNLKPAIDSFSFYLKKGRFEDNDIDPSQIKDVFWVENSGIYELEIGFIARKKGDYVVTIPDAIGKRNTNSQCNDAATIILKNSNLKNNLYIFYQYLGTSNVSVSDSLHTYSFRVR